MTYLERGPAWARRQSWYILLTLPLGLTSWLAFLYIGIRAKRGKWTTWGVFYLGSMILMFMQPMTTNAQGQQALPEWAGYRLILLWFFSIGHAIYVRREYLQALHEAQGGAPVAADAFVPYQQQKQAPASAPAAAAPRPAAPPQKPKRVPQPKPAQQPAAPVPTTQAAPPPPAVASPPPPPAPPAGSMPPAPPPPPAPRTEPEPPAPPPPSGAGRVIDF